MTRAMKLLAAAAFSAVSAGHAAATPGAATLHLADSADAGRMVLVLPLSARTAVGRATASRHALMHHFTAELLDRSGAPAPGHAVWHAELRVGTGSSTIRFGNRARTIALPRPWGHALAAGEMIQLEVSVDDAQDSFTLRLTIDYDPAGPGALRLPIDLQEATLPSSGPDAALRSWHFEVADDTRLSALLGSMLRGAREVLLHDVTTGELLLRLSLPGRDAAYASASSVVRPNALLLGGRTYRVTVRYADATDAPRDAGPLYALLRPAAAHGVAFR